MKRYLHFIISHTKYLNTFNYIISLLVHYLTKIPWLELYFSRKSMNYLAVNIQVQNSMSEQCVILAYLNTGSLITLKLKLIIYQMFRECLQVSDFQPFWICKLFPNTKILVCIPILPKPHNKMLSFISKAIYLILFCCYCTDQIQIIMKKTCENYVFCCW